MGAAELCRHVSDWAGDEPAFAIAFSGGPDSLALGRLAKEAGLCPTLLHVDHGTAEAGAGRHRAEQLAAELGLPFRCTQVVVDSKARGFEAGARNVRYAALRSGFEGRIWLAHTRDDFIETIWLRLLSGSSPLFWATMPARRGAFERPLLDIRRSDLVPWSEGAFADPMNQDGRFDRVWLRQTGLLPKYDPTGAIADLVVAVGERLQALRVGEWAAPLHELPDALRHISVRAQLAALLPDARPRQRFIRELAGAAARPSQKTRCFSVAKRSLYLRGGRLVLNS